MRPTLLRVTVVTGRSLLRQATRIHPDGSARDSACWGVGNLAQLHSCALSLSRASVRSLDCRSVFSRSTDISCICSSSFRLFDAGDMADRRTDGHTVGEARQFFVQPPHEIKSFKQTTACTRRRRPHRPRCGPLRRSSSRRGHTEKLERDIPIMIQPNFVYPNFV
jgi:hypothetical protein